jgi:hypothetical protein
MKKILILIPLLFILAACGGQTYPYGTPTPTPNPGEIALQMVQQQMAAEATAQVVGLQFTATAQVMGVTATHQAYGTQEAITQQARQDAQATAAQALAYAQATQQRIDIEATQVQARLDAEATQAQARLDLQATQQAEATSTAFVMTQAVMPTHNLWTQQAVEQQIIIATNEVELSNLAVQQQRQKNPWEWSLPMLGAVVLVIGFLLYVRNHSKVREIKNAYGDVDVLILNGETMITPRLLPKPVFDIETRQMPDMTDPDQQAEIVRRDQGIRALEVMPVNPAGHAVSAFNGYFSDTADAKKIPPVEILKPEDIGHNILEEIEGQVVEEG